MSKMLTKYIFMIIGLILFFIPSVVKAENKINIYFFRSEICPHCEKEREYFQVLKEKYSNIVILDYEVYYNPGNRELQNKVAKAMKIDGKYVPLTVIGERAFVGYSEEEMAATIASPETLEDAINYYSNHSYRDYAGEALGLVDKPNNNDKDSNTNDIKKINLPFIGSVDPKTFSLPIITIIIGYLDGINPCAMWVLLFLISMLIGMKDRKRMWILGLTFIVTSAVLYYAFLAAWLNVALFAITLYWFRLFISLVAVIAGLWNLRTAWRTRNGGCEIIDDKKRGKIFTRVKKFTHENSYLLAILGIALLAISVNIIDLFCSAGLPVLYSQVLAMNHLSNISYYLYLLLYVFFFMINEIIIYIIAMKTLKLKGLSTKFGNISHWVGGILMILIGLLLYFKPEWLSFGG